MAAVVALAGGPAESHKLLASPLISVENVSRIYGKGEARVAALSGVSFDINSGEFVAIIGSSGSLNDVGLADRMHHKPTQLSGGQQQRVAIARALVGEPEILLADEPTGALDSKTSEDIMTLLHKLNASGQTVIIITHDPEVAQSAQRVITLKDGEILSDVQTDLAA